MKRAGKWIPFKVFSASILASSIFMSGGSFASANVERSEKEINSKVEEIVQKGKERLIEQKKISNANVKEQMAITKQDINKETNKPYMSGDRVRVIVELDEEPLMDINTSKSAKSRILNKQQQVIDQVMKQRMATTIRHQFVQGINGFSLETEFQNIERLNQIPGVTNVRIANTYTQAMSSSKSLVQTQQVWEKYGLQGEGMIVAVVDSGVDYRHKDLIMSDEAQSKEKLTEANIQEKLEKTEINDRWYTDKVPTGYDWADMDDDVLPYQNSHGMHVAGTIGANGDEGNNGVVGIAPDVQILAEKVFSDYEGKAYEDDIVAGMKHAVEMGADVINLSLGSDSGFVGEQDDAIQKSIRLATKNGVLVVAAGGNAYYSTKTNKLPSAEKPFAENPDIGVVGSPGVSPYALQVASYENQEVFKPSLRLAKGNEIAYHETNAPRLSDSIDKETEYSLIFAGKGNEEDYKNIDVKDKLVVIQPEIDNGINSWLQINAARKGAKAVIIAPLASWGDYKELNFTSYSIPAGTTSV